MSNNHNFILTTNSLKPDTKGEYTIYVQYKYKTYKKSKVTPVKIPEQSWDKASNWIKESHTKKLDQEGEALQRLKDRFKYVRDKMAKGKMTIDEGFNYILNKINEKLLSDFVNELKPKPKLSESTINKHKMNLNAIESLFKRLGYNDLQQLTFVNLNSLDTVKKIAQVIKEEGGYKQNTIAGYLKTLNALTDYNSSPMLKPFSANNLIPSEVAGDNNAVYFAEVMEGLKKINTLHQFTAFLWWLYSLCLMGMDGKDIGSLSEDNICQDLYPDHSLKDYFPSAGEHYKKHFVNRIHVQLNRSKTEVKFVMMINLFPTLMIRDMLHRLLTATHPKIAYTGNDRIKLFNFDVNTTLGAKKWDAIRKSWSDCQRKCFGFTTKQARHTITKVGQDLGASKIDLNAQLGYNGQGVIQHYLTEDQTRLDILQTHILQEYGVLEILKIVCEDFEGRTELINNDKIAFIEEKDFEQTIDVKNEKVTIEFCSEKLMSNRENFDFTDNAELTKWGHKSDKQLLNIEGEVPDLKKYNDALKGVMENNDFKTDYSNLRYLVMMSGTLTPFSRADEWAFERLYSKEKERRWEKVNGKRVQVQPDFHQMSPDLQELIKKRFKTINPEGNFDALELGEKYL